MRILRAKILDRTWKTLIVEVLSTNQVLVPEKFGVCQDKDTNQWRAGRSDALFLKVLFLAQRSSNLDR